MFLAVNLAVAPPAGAQMRVAPESAAQVKLSYAPLVREAAPAVVNVYGARVRERGGADPMEEFFERFFGGGFGGAPRERIERSLGSGVIVDVDGLVVTNHHVIEGMTEVRVALVDRREFDAQIVLSDPRTDLAVLRIAASEAFPALELGDSEALEVGDIVLAIGNPFGVGQTVTQGIVSALARTQVGVTDYQFFIQTDAAINPGNSGGALLGMDGRVVGVNTAIFSRSGGSHGVGFAIPAAMVRAVVDSARMGASSVRRPWLGATLQAVTPDIAESVGLDRPSGVLVANVQSGSPAERAGLRRGDVIRAVAGRAVDDPDAFGYRFALSGVEGSARFDILRGGDVESLDVELIPPPETPPRDALVIASRSPLDGATVFNISPAVADELQLQGAHEGVVVAQVDPRSIAARYGFQPGDIILEVNRTQIGTTRDLDRALRASRGLWEMRINRRGQLISTVLRG
ncbi:MAG: Do family serine endopeptidase [Salinarimonadaceae bacterium]|nr:MAG: Do family serine endopeptidase [Salinarimonadaceae bacterium]